MIYVDKPTWPWKGQLWCHMVADSFEELNLFARKLGLHPGWIQVPPKTRYPHYDLNEIKHRRALELGAQHGDKSTIITCSKKLADEFWQFPPAKMNPRCRAMYEQWKGGYSKTIRPHSPT